MASFKRSRKPDVDQLLKDDSYQQIMELDFDDMIPFVMSNIRKAGIYSRLYLAINGFTLMGLAIWAVWGLTQGWLTWAQVVKQFIAGVFAGSILIIPFHELFHALAYWILGARKIQFGASLQQQLFFVTADRFPVTGKELLFLALLPFAAINVITLAVAILWVPQLSILCGFFLLAHNMMCIGDFAIVNYALNETGEIISYDEIENKKSYFYKKANDNLL